MARVRFVETCVTREERPQRFEGGREYEMTEASAARWEHLGKVVRLPDPPPPAEPKPVAAKPTRGRVPPKPKADTGGFSEATGADEPTDAPDGE